MIDHSQRPCSQPQGWLYIANICQIFSPPPFPITNKKNLEVVHARLLLHPHGRLLPVETGQHLLLDNLVEVEVIVVVRIYKDPYGSGCLKKIANTFIGPKS